MFVATRLSSITVFVSTCFVTETSTYFFVDYNLILVSAQYSINDLGDGLGTGTSKLQLTLSRGDLNARFECRVESEALDGPIISWVTADVHGKYHSSMLHKNSTIAGKLNFKATFCNSVMIHFAP